MHQGHIARQKNAPVRARVLQACVEPGERSGVGELVRADGRVDKVVEKARAVGDDEDAVERLAQPSRHVDDERRAVDAQHLLGIPQPLRAAPAEEHRGNVVVFDRHFHLDALSSRGRFLHAHCANFELGNLGDRIERGDGEAVCGRLAVVEREEQRAGCNPFGHVRGDFDFPPP